jgi:ketosteroid isomerase-like protein
MKKPLILIATALLAACNSTPTTMTAEKDSTKMESKDKMRPIQSPYAVRYSSSFVMDDPKNAETVLALWKAYDNGDLSATRDLIADTFEVNLAEGFSKRAPRDTVIAMIQAHRNMLAAAVDVVDAVMAVKSTDKNERWALVWGTEKDTHKDGKVDSVYLQETWRFNKDGKADLLYQYAQQTPMKKK